VKNASAESQTPPPRFGPLKVIASIVLVMLCLGAVLWLRPVRPPPVISVDVVS